MRSASRAWKATPKWMGCLPRAPRSHWTTPAPAAPPRAGCCPPGRHVILSTSPNSVARYPSRSSMWARRVCSSAQRIWASPARSFPVSSAPTSTKWPRKSGAGPPIVATCQRQEPSRPTRSSSAKRKTTEPSGAIGSSSRRRSTSRHAWFSMAARCTRLFQAVARSAFPWQHRSQGRFRLRHEAAMPARRASASVIRAA
ncbi:hypothetical protein FQZ97_927600 [compost metagenome]